MTRRTRPSHPLARAAACALLVIGVPAQAAEQAPNPASDPAHALVGLFVTLCVDNAADGDRIGDLAAGMGLRALAESDPALAPPAPGRRVRAWRLVGAGGAPMVLGVGSGANGTKLFSTCSLSAPDAAASAAEDALRARLLLGRPFRVEPDPGETTTYWHVPGGRYGTVVSATDRAPAGRNGVELALTVAQ